MCATSSLSAAFVIGALALGCHETDGRCPAGTKLTSGRDDDNEGLTARWCERPDGTRHGTYISYWESGARLTEGEIRDGQRQGIWRSYYDHDGGGGVVGEGRYVDGKAHGVWLAFAPHRSFSFATCLEHGEKRWQLTSREITESEALANSCP